MGRIWCLGKTLITIGALSLLTFGCDRGSDASATGANAIEASASVDKTPVAVKPPAAVKPTPAPAPDPVPAKPAATTKPPPAAATTTLTPDPTTTKPTPAPATTTLTPAPTTTKPTPPLATTDPAVPSESPASAAIRFDKLKHDFGQMLDTDKGRCTFPFVNTGSETLIIEQVKASCGCTAATLTKMVYAPGEGAEIDVTFSPKGAGKQSKTITVLSNAETGPQRLTIRAEVLPFVSFKLEPNPVRLGDLAMGVAHRGTFTVTSTDADMTVEAITGGGRYLTAELVDERPGEWGALDYEVAVTIGADAPSGAFRDSVSVTYRARPSRDAAFIQQVARVWVEASIVAR